MTEEEYLALPPSQRKEFQKGLKTKGLYHGPIDGASGDGMRTGLKAMGREKVEAEERARKGKIEEEAASADAEKKKADADAARADAEAKRAGTARKQTYDKEATSALGMTTQSAASVLSPALAGALGLKFGDKVNTRLDLAQDRRNATLRGAAEDRIKGLTTRDGAVAGTKLAGAMPYESRALRAISRMVPHMSLGALSMGKGAHLLSDVDEDQAFYPRMADRAAGLGYIGFGAGLAKRGIEYAASPGVSPDVQALSVINSSQLRRNNLATAAPDAKPLTPKQALLAEAKAAGIKGAAKKNMAQLQAALKALPKPSIIAPLAAGAVAFGATPNRAEASPDGTGGGSNTSERLTNAGIAGGATVAAGSGMQRLGKVLSRVAPTAMRAAGRVAGPVGIGLGAYDVVQGIDSLAHLSPPQDPSVSLSAPFMPPEADPAYAPDPQDGGIDALIGAAEQDPEIAAMIQQMIQERLSAQPVQ